MKLSGIILFVLGTCFINNINGLLDPISLTAAALTGLSGIYFGYEKYVKCAYNECCTKKYIHHDIHGLIKVMEKELFGQHIAKSVVPSALRAHISSRDPPKALSISFHGLAGTGKNFVATMIANSIYTKGENSKYCHFFNGRNDFPSERNAERHKESLLKIITESLDKCQESLFIFDEVDMMPPTVLNALVPFLDYGPTHVWKDNSRVYVVTNKAIFIFLSNTGSQTILDTSLSLWRQGKPRHEMKMSDFENLIAMGAFNERGGFEKSDTISTNLIDHYVPFLPLETEHIEMCIHAAFRARGEKPTDQQIQEVMSHVTFGPDGHNLYARGGCKRIEQKVGAIIYRRT